MKVLKKIIFILGIAFCGSHWYEDLVLIIS